MTGAPLIFQIWYIHRALSCKVLRFVESGASGRCLYERFFLGYFHVYFCTIFARHIRLMYSMQIQHLQGPRKLDKSLNRLIGQKCPHTPVYPARPKITTPSAALEIPIFAPSMISDVGREVPQLDMLVYVSGFREWLPTPEFDSEPRDLGLNCDNKPQKGHDFELFKN